MLDTQEESDRDLVLTRLMRCSSALLRAQADGVPADDVVRLVLTELDASIRALRGPLGPAAQ